MGRAEGDRHPRRRGEADPGVTALEVPIGGLDAEFGRLQARPDRQTGVVAARQGQGELQRDGHGFAAALWRSQARQRNQAAEERCGFQRSPYASSSFGVGISPLR